MHFHTKVLAFAIALAAGAATTTFAQSNQYGAGNADNSNAVIHGSTNSDLMDRSPTYGSPTGAGHADNTNSMSANPDDFMRDTNRAHVYSTPLDNRSRQTRDMERRGEYRDVPSGVPYERR